MHRSLNSRRQRVLPDRQRGAALAISLLILTVLTLLGIAALRSSRLELRLSQNAESRVNALQTAQAMADSVTQADSNLSIGAGPAYVACFKPTSNDTQPDNLPFVCTSSGVAVANAVQLRSYTYAQVLREAPEFLTTGTLRGAGDSSRAYDFARFTVTGGYDHSAQGFGAAEVVQGVLKLHAKPQGVTYQ